MRGGITLLTVINYDIYSIVALGQSALYLFQAVILEEFLSIPTVISPPKPRGNFMYRSFCTAKYYKKYIKAHLWVSYEFYNKRKYFPSAAIAVSFYNRDGECLLRGTDYL
jgi:hypothetical protein